MRPLDGSGPAAGAVQRASVPQAGGEPSPCAPAAALGRLALLYPLVLLPVGWLGLPRTLVGAPKALPLGGGVQILAGDGDMVGAIGVSGAPSGSEDEACAKAGIAAIEDQIAF